MLELIVCSFVCTIVIASFCFLIFTIIGELKSVDSKGRKILLTCVGLFLFVWFVLFLVCYIGGYYVC